MGHVPRLISTAWLLFLRIETNTIKCRITDLCQYSADLPQGSLEIPCKLIFRGDKEKITKVKKLTVYPYTQFLDSALLTTADEG